MRRDRYPLFFAVPFSKEMKAAMTKEFSEGSHNESTIRKLVKRNVSDGISSHEFQQHLTRAVKANVLVKVRQTTSPCVRTPPWPSGSFFGLACLLAAVFLHIH